MDLLVFLKENTPKGDLFVYLKENAPKGEVFEYMKAYIPNGDKFKKTIAAHTGLSPPVFLAAVAVASAISFATVAAISSVIMPSQKSDVHTEVATAEEEKQKECCIATNGDSAVESVEEQN